MGSSVDQEEESRLFGQIDGKISFCFNQFASH
jgi:hypothetical protein